MGPTEEALALADFLIADFGPSLDRHSLAYAIMEHEEAAYIAQQPPAEAQAQGGGEVVWPMTEAEVRQWIGACNHEAARQVLRDYLQLRTAPPSAPVGVEGLAAQLRRELGAGTDKDYPYTEYEKGRVAEKERLLAILAQQPAPVAPAPTAANAWVGVTDELLINIQRACKRGRNASDPTPDNSSFIASFDHIEDLAQQARHALEQQPAPVAHAGVDHMHLRGLLEEVRSICTRDDDLPDNLLPRIDAALAQPPAADPLVEWANSPLNFTATVGMFKDGVQPAAVDEAMAFTDAAVDAIQSRMADLGFVVPVRVISDGVSAALAAQQGDES